MSGPGETAASSLPAPAPSTPKHVGALPAVALVGRPNAGKTSLLMHLSGRPQRPVNFPGSSVEREEAELRHPTHPVRLVDLPGIASLDPGSPEEALTIGWLRDPETRPAALCAVLDATRLDLELPLLASLRELALPTVVVLTRVDLTPAELDTAVLTRALGVPVFAVNALDPGPAATLDPLRLALVSAASPGVPAPTLAPAPPITTRHERQALVAAASRPHPVPRNDRRALSDRIDAVLLHPVLGLPLFLALTFGIFQLLFRGAEPLVALIEAGQGLVGDAIRARFDDPLPGAFESFLVDGLVGGVGASLVFLPQIAMLMGLLAVLESTGYMARAVFLLDRVLSPFGLSGRSFVPLASSFACAVPGVLATRNLDSTAERLTAMFVAPLMSCSARLPVHVLLLGAFFTPSEASTLLFLLYLLGVGVALILAVALRRTVLRGRTAALVLELPVYERPAMRVVLFRVASACRAFLLLAGTAILAASVLVWALSWFPRDSAAVAAFAREDAALGEEAREAGARGDTTLQASLEARREALGRETEARLLEGSALAGIGKAVAPVFAPAGFDWRVTVGILTAFPARELIIPTLGILYREGAVDPGEYAALDAAPDDAGSGGLRGQLREAGLTPLRALALMVFFALCSQCMATLAAIGRESRSWRWPVAVFCTMTALAWLAAVGVYQLGLALGHT
jgi:ferrous iron transport protein B